MEAVPSANEPRDGDQQHEPSSAGSSPATASASQPWLNVLGSRHFIDWLAEQRVSLAFTTYQTGKLFLVGRKPGDAISVFERTFNHCMGLWASPDAQTLWALRSVRT